MLSFKFKRCFTFFLVLAMLFSLLPIHAIAEEQDTLLETTAVIEDAASDTSLETSPVITETEPVDTTESGAADSSAIGSILERMDTIVTAYLSSATLTEDEVSKEVAEMDWETYRTALWEISQLEGSDEVAQLTESELDALEEACPAFFFLSEALQARYAQEEGQISLLADVGSPISNVSISYSYSNTLTSHSCTLNDDGSVTVYAKGGNLSGQTVTVTISYTVSEDSVFGFNYSASGTYSTFTIDGSNASATSFSKDVSTSGSISLVLKVAKKTNATVVLSGFSLAKKVSSATVGITHNSLGSVTVGGAAVASGNSTQVSGDTGAEFIAKPSSSSVTFLGWINSETNELIDSNATFTYKPTKDINITAVFVNSSSSAYFKNGAYLFDDLNKANANAVATSYKTIVLMNNATLPAGNYTISSGVTLLIPYDTAETCIKENVTAVEGSSKPTAFRTLTMNSGAHLTVNGDLSVSARLAAGMGKNSTTYGAAGYIRMNSNSSITVNSGANLYAWGYILGSGEVVVNSGGTVYEPFQVSDWRGGNATLSMIDNEQKVFPVCQYYVQNIEVPMKLYAGATEVGSLNVDVSIYGIKSPSVPFIGGSSSMFYIQSGYIVKDYEESTDRLNIDIYGELSVNSIKIDIVKGTFINVTLKSENYVLPVTNNMTIKIHDGSSVNISQDMSILPGAVLNVTKGAELNVASGASIYIYDLDEWKGKGYLYGDLDIRPLYYDAPGRTKSSDRTADELADAKIIIEGTVTATNGAAYTTASGAAITGVEGGTITVTAKEDATTYQAKQSGNEISSYEPITVNAPWLQNGNGTYVKTKEIGSGTYTYISGFWHYPGCDGSTTETNTATCEAAGIKTVTCTCRAINTTTEVAALGHDYGEGVTTLPKVDTEGYITYTCSRDSSHTKKDPINVAQVGEQTYTLLSKAFTDVATDGTVTLLSSIDGEVEVSKAMTIHKGSYEANILPATGYYISEETNTTVTIQKRIIAGTSVRAGDCLDIYFWVTGLEGDGYTAKFSDDSTIPAEEWITDEATGMRRFAFKGITAKRMTETVSVTIYDSENNPVSETATESIEGYALRTLEKNSNTELRTALVDMLNYGADAQTYFNHDTTTLANAKLTDTQKGYGTSEDATVENDMKKITETGDISFVGASVTAGNELYLSFYFNGLDERSNIKAVVTYTDHYENQRTREIAGSSFVSTSGYWGPQVTGLAVADGRQLVNCKIYNGSTLVAEAECSIEGYAAKTIADNENNSEKTALVAVCKSLMRFVDSAYAYFH